MNWNLIRMGATMEHNINVDLESKCAEGTFNDGRGACKPSRCEFYNICKAESEYDVKNRYGGRNGK